MLTPQDTVAIDQRIQAYMASGQFNLNRVPFHTHNGKDSPFIFLPTVQYAGLLNSDGTLSRVYPFPSGWSRARTGNGVYTITHNLNTTFYSVVATPIASAANVRAMTAVLSNVNANSFTVAMFAPGLLTATGAISGTSLTLSAAWQDPSGSYIAMFSDGEFKTVTLTNGATTCSWTGSLTNTCDPSFAVTLDTVFNFVLTHVTNTKPGWPLYNKNAT